MLIYLLNRKPQVEPPNRLSTIPTNTQWVGGADGGNWYQIKKVWSPNDFSIAIYNENTGEIEVDTIFTISPDCKIKAIDSLSLIQSFNFFDGNKISIILKETGERCFLIMK